MSESCIQASGNIPIVSASDLIFAFTSSMLYSIHDNGMDALIGWILKPNRSIKLPVTALLKQYKDCRNTIVRHFDLLYIQQGVERLPIQVRTIKSMDSTRLYW